jgi:hypothetical protein
MPREDTQFKKGKAPGRPKGARNKFSQAFIKDVADSWKKNGAEALESLRKDKLDAYVRTAGSLVPKDLDVKHSGDITVQVVDYAEDE